MSSYIPNTGTPDEEHPLQAERRVTKSCTLYPKNSDWSWAKTGYTTGMSSYIPNTGTPDEEHPLQPPCRVTKILHSIPLEECMILDPCLRASPTGTPNEGHPLQAKGTVTKSCTVYPWKSAWSSIPALELRSWYPWRRTPLPSWTHGHEIMHSIAQEQCMIFDPCARATSKQGPEHPAQYTPARVHDLRSVR